MTESVGPSHRRGGIGAAAAGVARFVAGFEPRAWRRLAIAAALVQLAGVVVAVRDHLMLEGDGSFFVYAIAVGRPWLLKWQDVTARATVYVLTVAPTAWIARLAHLSPMAIADLNGLVFYLVPLIQFLVGCAMVWRREPRLLAFPVALYAFASAIQYGYPSEITLAPGFLWICLFLVERGRAMSLAALACFVGLWFSHELAIPAALMVAGLAAVRERRKPRGVWRIAAIAGLSLVCLALTAASHLSGGTRGEVPLTDAFPPDVLVQSVSLWLVLSVCGLTLLAALLRPGWFRRPLAWWLTAALAGVAPLLFAAIPGINFEHGLYPTGRTVVAIDMTVLTVLFVAERLGGAAMAQSRPALAGRVAAPIVLASLACQAGCALAFLGEFNLALQGVERVAVGAPGHGPTQISLADALTSMTPAEADAARDLQFAWVLPYRSAVLADGAAPAHILYNTFNAKGFRDYCRRSVAIDPARSAIPPVALAEVRDYACAQ